MAQEVITIKFKPEGHQDLIGAIDKLSASQKKLNKSSAVTTKSSTLANNQMLQGALIMNATSKSAGALSSKMGATAKSAGALGTKFARNAKNTNMLSMAFSVMRSRMLLLAFGMTLVVDPLTRLVKEAAGVHSLRKAFDTLSGGVGKSKIAFDRLRNATNNTMSEMDLLKQANNAMVLGITDSSSEMAEMFDIAQRLGRALGRDTADSVESLITGIGRQSRLMLDNIGIIVKSEEAYEAYAKELGISVDKLTDAEKKQAFFNATMTSAREKVSRLGREQLSSVDKFNQLTVATQEFRKEVGELLLPILESMAGWLESGFEGMTDFLKLLRGETNQIDPLISFRESLPDDKKAVKAMLDDLESQLKKIQAPTIDTSAIVHEEAKNKIIEQQDELEVLRQFYSRFGVDTSNDIKDMQAEFNNLTANMTNSEANFAKLAETDISAIVESARQLGVNVSDIPEFDGVKFAADFNLPLHDIEMQSFVVAELIRKYKKLFEEQSTSSESNEKIGQSFEIISINMDDNIDLIEEYAKKFSDGTGFVISASNDLSTTITEAATPAMNEFSETMPVIDDNILILLNKIDVLKQKLLELEQGSGNSGNGLTKLGEKFSEFWGKNQENAELLVQSFSGVTSAMRSELDARMRNEMQALKESSKYKLAQERGDRDAIEKMEKDKTKAFAKERKRLWFMEKAASLGEAGINIANAITKALPNVFLASLVGAMGAVQIAAIASTKPPKFAQGGLIGGRRHSQGGTLIEAEQGEFIMSRNAVQSVGLEAMNRINQGEGSTSNVTVNVSGNVLTQDFVEGELAENIKDAIRRGTDFGIG